MTEDPKAMRLALRRVWEEVAGPTFRRLGRHTLRGGEVRDAVLARLAEESGANANIRRFWTALSEQQRREALFDAFPDGPYTDRPSRDEDFADADLLPG